MLYNNIRFDELAMQMAVIEQVAAATLAELHAELAGMRAEIVALTIAAAVETLPGIDPAAFVTTDRAAVIRVMHTFDNETTPQAPFSLGANTSGQWVGGLNADKLDGQEGSYYSNYANLSNKPTNITVYPTSPELMLTTALQDVPGLTTGNFTPSVNEKVLIFINIALNKYAGTAPCNNNDAILYQLQINGASVLSTNIIADSGAGSLGVTRAWLATLTAGTSYTIKVQSQNATGNRGLIGAQSQLVVWRMGA